MSDYVKIEKVNGVAVPTDRDEIITVNQATFTVQGKFSAGTDFLVTVLLIMSKPDGSLYSQTPLSDQNSGSDVSWPPVGSLTLSSPPSGEKHHLLSVHLFNQQGGTVQCGPQGGFRIKRS